MHRSSAQQTHPGRASLLCEIRRKSLKLTSMHPQSVKLFGEREVEHPARQGERYIRPSDPHT